MPIRTLTGGPPFLHGRCVMAGANRPKGILGQIGGLFNRRSRKAESKSALPRAATVRAAPAGRSRPVFGSAAHPLMHGRPPEWATGWGEDRHGVWVDFSVGEVSQRMRWIGPGHFQMGSPESEPGRFGADEYEGKYNEGPQHEVRIGAGYWLFDTPVTQAAWTAVMGDNPSRFKDPKRPVEQVSWDDAIQFLERINVLIPGLDLVLPTEAQWEYACRAGTETATYAGPIEIRGENNAPVLDGIAWYGGNSGVGFELDDGYDSSGWKEKQYEHTKAGTHPVGLKTPNPWGLYDMLGNVWEWCSDDLRPFTGEPVTGPGGPLDGASRALRGGSWGNDARDVRAADRFENGREHRDDDIGFRAARVRP